MSTGDPCEGSLDPLCGSGFSPYSGDAVAATCVAWVVALAIMWLLFVLIWPWEGGLRRRAGVISSFCHLEPSQPGLILNRPLVAEKLMLLAYLYFWVTTLAGVVLTRWSGLDLSRSPLKRVFGYNNLCVYFDTAPASYALPFLFAVTLVFLLGWQAVQFLVMNEQFSKRNFSPAVYRLLCTAHCFTSLSFIFFSTSFAVNPALETVDPDHFTLILHTVPFLLMQWGIFAMFTCFAVYAHVTSYWQSLGLPQTADFAGMANSAAVFTVVLLKGIFTWCALLKRPALGHDSALPAVLDVLFLVLAAVVPVVISLLLLAFKYDRLRKTEVRVGNQATARARCLDRCPDRDEVKVASNQEQSLSASPRSATSEFQLDPVSPMPRTQLESPDLLPPVPVAAWAEDVQDIE